jgi:FkbM family methyltransferase
VGANVGHYTIPIGRKVGPQGRVISIEPVCETFELLTSNVNSAGLTNVTLLNLAASSLPGVVNIAIPRDDVGLRRMTRAHVTNHEGPSVLSLPVDRVFTPHRIRLVKIDAEGHERKVLEGMHDILARDRPLLIVEASPDHVVPLLDQLGYEPTRLTQSPNIIYTAPGDRPATRRLNFGTDSP